MFAAQFAIVVAILVAWELLSGNPGKGQGLVDEFFVGRPSLIAQRLTSWIASGVMLESARITLVEAALGFVLGSLTGMALGFAFGVTTMGRLALAPLVFAAYSIPRLGLTPLFILWFGLGIESKVALVWVIVFFLTFFSTFQGAREVDRELVAVCQLMKASRWQIVRKVTVPSALVWVALGLKLSVPSAFAGAIVAEIVAGNVGLGALMTQSANEFDPSGLFAAAFVATVLAIGMNALIARLVAIGLRWRNTDVTSSGVVL